MIDFRNDIRHFSDRELSILVMNDAYFYNEIDNRDYFYALVNEQFNYNDAQLADLLDTLERHDAI